MNLDSARNAKAEILRKAMGFQEVPGSTGRSGLPEFVLPDDLARTAIIAEAQQNWKRRIGRGLGSIGPSVTAGFAPGADGVTDLDSAFGRFDGDGMTFSPGPSVLEHDAFAEPAADLSLLPPPLAVGIQLEDGGTKARPVMFLQKPEYKSHPAIEKAQELTGNEARLVITGPVKKFSHWQPAKRRPLMAGTSIAHYRVSAGTLGAFVRDRQGELAILSNNHVLARVNRALIGDPATQSSKNDGGEKEHDSVAVLSEFVPVESRPGSVNYVDCALANLLPLETIQAGFPESNIKVRGSHDDAYFPMIDEAVVKFGRTTGFSEGQVFAIEVDNQEVNLGSDLRPIRCRFDDQIQIYSQDGKFARPGDSGSLVLTPDGMAMGLLFAGARASNVPGGWLTAVNPIQRVFSELEATLWIE